MHRHAMAALLLASTLVGVPRAHAGYTILIGPQTMAPVAAVSPASGKLGEGIVEFVVQDQIVATRQSFATLLSRNLGPQRVDQRFVSHLTARLGAGNLFESLLWVSDDEDFRDSAPRTHVSDLGSVVGGTVGGLGGLRLGGERLFAGLNLSTGTDTFHPWLFSFALPRSGGAPALRASLDLAPGFPGSAEVTDVQFVTPPTSDGANGVSTYFLVAEKQSGDCHSVKFGKAQYLDDTQIFNSNFYLDPLSGFSECHTRSARFAEMSSERARFEDAQLLWMGVRLRNTPTSAESVGLYQIRDQGNSAALDIQFGGDGQVKIQHASGLNMRFWDLANHGDKLYVSIGVEGPQVGAYQPIIVRLNKDGTLASGFGNNGIVSIPATGLSTNPRTISTGYNGGVQATLVTGETYTASTVRPFAFFHTLTSPAGAPETYTSQHVEYAFPDRLNSTFFTHEHAPDGTITVAGANFGSYPDVSTMRPFLGRLAGPPGTTKAIEYFHTGLGHYAVISIPAEVQALDSGTIAGWSRTGFWFNVHASETPGTLGVDRFFSEAFAPKSSHFYTSSSSEFAILQGSPVWKHEGRTFFAPWPSFANRCPPTMRPVKRVYNNGVTGAPNHQYADDETVIAQAIARGGVIESGAVDGSFFCSE